MLGQMGWPRRSGLFNSNAVIDTTIAEASTAEMIDFAAAIGACRPKLALQILACMFKDRNWEDENAPQILLFIENAKNDWNSKKGSSPREIIKPIEFSKYGKTIEAKLLNDREVQAALEQIFLAALLWGLANPEDFKTWYEEDARDKTEKLPEYQKANLDVGSIPSLPEYLDECERMIKGYEEKMGELPTIPPRLLEDARVLGRKIED